MDWIITLESIYIYIENLGLVLCYGRETSICGTGIQYGHWFEPCLFHFLLSSLLSLGKQWKMAVIGHLHPLGTSGGIFWFWSGPAACIVVIWRISQQVENFISLSLSFSLNSAFQVVEKIHKIMKKNVFKKLSLPVPCP